LYYSGGPINTQSILSIIREIVESLSLTSEPDQLLNMALDTTSRVLDLECCWVQLVSLSSHDLSLSAYRGFTPPMMDGMTALDLTHSLGKEVIGLGNTVIIPDISQDGHYNISLFEKAGFRSLIAVPVITYRVNGMMGAAYRIKKRFTKEYSGLFAAIAGITGMALNKYLLTKQVDDIEEPQLMDRAPLAASPVESSPVERPEPSGPEVAIPAGHVLKSEAGDNDNAYQEHVRRMKAFRNLHNRLIPG